MKRHLEITLKKHFEKYKQVLILLGSRQVGKTTLVRRLFPEWKYFLVDNEPIRNILESYDAKAYKVLINKDEKNIIIDEIHLLSDPGRCIKILYDEWKDLRIIITGSSAFHIKNKTTESLAGRKIDYTLYPLTFSEYIVQKGIDSDCKENLLENIEKGLFGIEKNPFSVEKKYQTFDIKRVLEEVLLFGQYPHLVEHPEDEKFLRSFVESFVFKDIIELNLIENKRLALNLLKLLAFQIGSIVNYSELANSLGADARTIRRYIEIFEQSFVLFRLFPYSQRKRDEITKSPKIYFYDTGIRNALVEDFRSLEVRSDKGSLFENFVIGELIKQNTYLERYYKMYYWRTKQGSEVDIVLENANGILGGEIKFAKKRINTSFGKRYPHTKMFVITADNFLG